MDYMDDARQAVGFLVDNMHLPGLNPINCGWHQRQSRELGSMGSNYFKSLLAVGFQGVLILVCVAIYAVLVQSIAIGSDVMNAVWTCIGYTVLLCFTLFKTGSLAKSIFGAH